MKCSVIIPLFNKSKYISTTIQSVIEQSYQDFEIIIIDDGSEDDSLLKVKNFLDPRIKLIKQVNKGVSSARNIGIDYASGEIICFLDADDWYQPTYLETIVSLWEQNINYAFFATGYKRITDSENIDLYWKNEESVYTEYVKNIYLRMLNDSIFITTSSIAVRRKILLQFKPYFPIGEESKEDFDLWCRIGEKFTLVLSSAKLVGYRIDVPESLTKNYNSLILEPFYIRIQNRIIDKTMPIELIKSSKRVVGEAKITIIRKLLINGDRYLAFKELFMTKKYLLYRRWWVSLIMCIFVPLKLIKNWEAWRIRLKFNEHN